MKTKITKIIGRQIIDSRGNPTVEADVYLNENFFGRADYLWMTWECWTCLPTFKKAGKVN